MKSLVPLRCQRPLVALNCAAHERLNRFKVVCLPVSLKISDVVHGVIKNKHTSKVQTGFSLFKSGIQTNSCFSRRTFHLTRVLCFSFEAGLREKPKVQVIPPSLAFGGVMSNERDRSLSAVTFSAAHVRWRQRSRREGCGTRAKTYWYSNRRREPERGFAKTEGEGVRWRRGGEKDAVGSFLFFRLAPGTDIKMLILFCCFFLSLSIIHCISLLPSQSCTFLLLSVSSASSRALPSD